MAGSIRKIYFELWPDTKYVELPMPTTAGVMVGRWTKAAGRRRLDSRDVEERIISRCELRVQSLCWSLGRGTSKTYERKRFGAETDAVITTVATMEPSIDLGRKVPRVAPSARTVLSIPSIGLPGPSRGSSCELGKSSDGAMVPVMRQGGWPHRAINNTSLLERTRVGCMRSRSGGG